MHKGFRAALACLLLATALARGEDAPPAAESTSDQASYAIGLNIGSDLRSRKFDVNIEKFIQGFKDGQVGKEALPPEQMQKLMLKFVADVAKRNAKEGEAFLAENAKKEGVKTTASGLQYKVIKEGDGTAPTATDTVTAHYKGALVDGSVFDQTKEQPASFPLGNVIPGWTEGLQLMKVGAKYQFFIPSKLAYGEQGRPPQIGPNLALIFEIELIGIGRQPQPKP